MAEDQLFCIGQKAVIEKDGEVLVLHDPIPAPGNIDLPGGKIQTGELDFTIALQREVYEETCLNIKVGRPFYTSYWEFKRDSTHRNSGKKIYLVFYACEYMSGELRISTELDWFKWVTKENYSHKLRDRNNIFEALTVYFNELKK